MISQYSKKQHDTFVYKKLENSLVDLVKTHNTDNLNVEILNNSEIISDSFEVVLEKRIVYDNAVQLVEIS